MPRSKGCLCWEDLPQDVIDEIVLVYALDTPLELMALALVNRAMLQRIRLLLHRMVTTPDDICKTTDASEFCMSRFSRYMEALAQLPSVHLMRPATIRTPEAREIALCSQDPDEAVGGDRIRSVSVGLNNGLPNTMVFYCAVCHSPVLVNCAILSDNYHGGRGPAFLVDWIMHPMIVEERLAYTTTFTTGRYVVCDVKCSTCNSAVGKKYLAPMDPTNVFKANKFLIEQAALYVPECCRNSAQRRVYSLKEQSGPSDEICTRCLARTRRATAEAILRITADFAIPRVGLLYDVMQEQASAWSGASWSLVKPIAVVRSHSEGFLKRALRFVIGDRPGKSFSSATVPLVSENDCGKNTRYKEKLSGCLARMLVWVVTAEDSTCERRNTLQMLLDDGILEAISKVTSSAKPGRILEQAAWYDKIIILEGLIRGISLSPAHRGDALSVRQARSLVYEVRRKWIDSPGTIAAPLDSAQLRRMPTVTEVHREEESRILMTIERLRRSNPLAHLRTSRSVGAGDKNMERRLSLLVTAVANVTEDVNERDDRSRLRIKNELGAILGLPAENLQSRSSSVDMWPPENTGKSFDGSRACVMCARCSFTIN